MKRSYPGEGKVQAKTLVIKVQVCSHSQVEIIKKTVKCHARDTQVFVQEGLEAAHRPWKRAWPSVQRGPMSAFSSPPEPGWPTSSLSSEQVVGSLYSGSNSIISLLCGSKEIPSNSLVSVSLCEMRVWIRIVFLHFFFLNHTPFWINTELSFLFCSIYDDKTSNHFPNQKL